MTAWEISHNELVGDMSALQAHLGDDVEIKRVQILVDPRKVFVIGDKLIFDLDAVCGYLD